MIEAFICSELSEYWEKIIKNNSDYIID